MANQYYCDCCGHVFNTPAGSWNEVDGRDEDETHCPRCKNRDYELLKPEEDGHTIGLDTGLNLSISLYPAQSLGGRLHSSDT